MAKFTTRVELLDATYPADYDKLHTAMAAEGFTRTIKNGTGVEYYLPMAEYNMDKDITRDEVLAAAKRSAGKTGREHRILVTESNGRTWHGLDPVKVVAKK